MTQPHPITLHRSTLTTEATRGHTDALLGRAMTPPRSHRATRRAYVTEYVRTLNSIGAVAEALGFGK